MKIIKTGIIPAAGRGNRLSDLPLAKILPKPMLPILNKPILEYALNNMKALGVEVVYMVVGHKKNIIKDYFENGMDWNVKIEYIEQRNPKGIAHAVSLLEDYVSEPFAVILGDDLTVSKSINDIVKTFWKNKAWAVEGVVFEKDVKALKRTCCLTIDKDGKIVEIEEKPENPRSCLRGCGIYVFDPCVFEFIENTPFTPPRNEKEITTTLKMMCEQGKAYALSIDGANINVNTYEDLVKAAEIIKSKFGERL